MSTRNPFDRQEMRFEVGPESGPAREIDSGPVFRLLVVGDFSGAVPSARAPLASRRAIEVDRDNFDDVLRKVAPHVMLSIGDEAPFPLKIADIDDFRPEAIFERNPLFLEMRRLRARLEDPDRWRAAAEELGQEVSPAAKPAAPSGPAAPVTARSLVGGGSLLDAMVEQESPTPSAPQSKPSSDPVLEIARRAVQPYLVSATTQEQTALLANMDEAISARMREVLHHPGVRAVEASWRSLYLLIRTLDTGPDLKVSFFDITREELQEDLFSSDDLSESNICRLLVEDPKQHSDDSQWAAVAATFRFGADADDLRALNRLMKLAKAANAPFLANSTPGLAGVPAFEGVLEPRHWTGPTEIAGGFFNLLRRQPEAPWLGLVAPRFLLRLPYGAKTDPCDAFPFEEIPGEPTPADYLWGPASCLVAMLLGQAFSDHGWDFKPGTVAEVKGLPLHLYRGDAGPASWSCAEAWFTEGAVEELAERGMIVVVPYKDQDRVRIFQMNSIAEPYSLIRGAWQG
ncbi:MAG: type VI secretion system contractile sheath large subunit [Bryobacterales bacterium]|nr:type VI secretion system contractile sheath large subunit [Bryobacterales bacterium]